MIFEKYENEARAFNDRADPKSVLSSKLRLMSEEMLCGAKNLVTDSDKVR